jgi:hypothetical protein
MRKSWTALVLLFAALCLAGGDKPKEDKFLPPTESHGMTISAYGCDRLHVADNSESSFWKLVFWAQYGEKHKRYWEKSSDTYKVPVKHPMGSSGESAGSGAPIGGYSNTVYDFTLMDKGCTAWGDRVQTALKIGPTGEKIKE